MKYILTTDFLDLPPCIVDNLGIEIFLKPCHDDIKKLLWAFSSKHEWKSINGFVTAPTGHKVQAWCERCMGWEVFLTRVFFRFDILSWAINVINCPLSPQWEIWVDVSQFFVTNPDTVVAQFMIWGIIIQRNNMLHNRQKKGAEWRG